MGASKIFCMEHFFFFYKKRVSVYSLCYRSYVCYVSVQFRGHFLLPPASKRVCLALIHDQKFRVSVYGENGIVQGEPNKT